MGAHVTHLVEENGAFVSFLEAPDPLLERSGKRTFDVAE